MEGWSGGEAEAVTKILFWHPRARAHTHTLIYSIKNQCQLLWSWSLYIREFSFTLRFGFMIKFTFP